MPSLLEAVSDRFHASRAARSVGLVVALLAALGLALLGAAPAAAHAELDHSDPPVDAIVATSPPQVTLYFTEEIETKFSSATLDDQTGHPVAGATSHPGPGSTVLILAVPPHLPDGTYSVVWQTVSKDDGHYAEGYFSFTVGTQANAAAVVVPTLGAAGPPSWVQAVARWLAFIGLAVAVAIWPLWLLVLRPAISPAWQAGPNLTRRVRRLAVAALLLALLGDIAVLLVQADAAPGGFVHAVVTTLRDTRFGRLWLLRLGLLFAYASALTVAGWWWPWRRKVEAVAALALAAVLALPFSLVAHAAAQPAGRTSAVAADLLHLLAASLWVGGLVLLVGGLGPTLRDLTPAGRRAVLLRAIPRFSLLALTAWGVMGITGLYAAWLQVGDWAGLRTTAYGHTLTVKVLLLAPLLALGAFNLLVVTRRLRRATDEGAVRAWCRHFLLAISAEVVLAVAVLVVVGLLTSQDPARDVLASRVGQASLTFHAGGRSATLTVAPATPGFNRDRLTITRPALPAAATVILRLTPPQQALGQQDLTMVRAVGNVFEAQTGNFSLLGTWTVELIVRVPGRDDLTATQPLAIGTTPPVGDVPSPPWRFGELGLLGLLLLAGGIGGIVAAALGVRGPRRTALGGVGLAVVVVGLLLLLQGRTSAAHGAASGIPTALAPCCSRLDARTPTVAVGLADAP